MVLRTVLPGRTAGELRSRSGGGALAARAAARRGDEDGPAASGAAAAATAASGAAPRARRKTRLAKCDDLGAHVPRPRAPRGVVPHDDEARNALAMVVHDLGVDLERRVPRPRCVDREREERLVGAGAAGGGGGWRRSRAPAAPCAHVARTYLTLQRVGERLRGRGDGLEEEQRAAGARGGGGAAVLNYKVGAGGQARQFPALQHPRRRQGGH